MSSIFVSYRRNDAPGHAGRLYDRLVDRFGEANVFKDLDSLEPGADFEEVIEGAIARCDALIAVIGRDWLAPGPDGSRRLDDPADWVRLEIYNALKRRIRVVPVLVEEAQLPAPSELPEDLQPLTRRHAVELRESAWGSQVTHLIDGLERALGQGHATPDASPPSNETSDASPPPSSEPQGEWTVRVRDRTENTRTLELRTREREHVLFLKLGGSRNRVTLDGEAISTFIGEVRADREEGSVNLHLPMTLGESQCVLRAAFLTIGGLSGTSFLTWVTVDVDGQRVYEEGDAER